MSASREVPLLTVSMPAYNAGRFIGEAIASVLAQEEIDLVLVVVDDASTDDTAAVVERVGDARVSLIRNRVRRGVAACHNLVVAHSESPFIAHVDADDVIVPCALRTMVAALAAAPTAGQAYCHYLRVDQHGLPFGRPFTQQRELMIAQRRAGLDYRRAMICHGMVVNTLRTYRRDALATVGPFNERLRYAVDYDMAMRIAASHDIVLVPEFLYLVRIHGANLTEALRFKRLRFWWKRAGVCHRLLRDGEGMLLGRTRRGVYGLLLLGLLHTFELPRIAKRLVRAPGRMLQRWTAPQS